MKHGLTIVLCLCAAKAWAAWEVLTISADKQVVIYAETATLRREGDFVFTWVIYNRSTAAPDGNTTSTWVRIILNRCSASGMRCSSRPGTGRLSVTIPTWQRS